MKSEEAIGIQLASELLHFKKYSFADIKDFKVQKGVKGFLA